MNASVKLMKDRLARRVAAKKTRLAGQTSTALHAVPVPNTGEKDASLRHQILLQEIRRLSSAIASIARRLDQLVPKEETSSVQRTDNPEQPAQETVEDTPQE